MHLANKRCSASRQNVEHQANTFGRSPHARSHSGLFEHKRRLMSGSEIADCVGKARSLVSRPEILLSRKMRPHRTLRPPVLPLASTGDCKAETPRALCHFELDLAKTRSWNTKSQDPLLLMSPTDNAIESTERYLPLGDGALRELRTTKYWPTSSQRTMTGNLVRDYCMEQHSEITGVACCRSRTTPDTRTNVIIHRSFVRG